MNYQTRVRQSLDICWPLRRLTPPPPRAASAETEATREWLARQRGRG